MKLAHRRSARIASQPHGAAMTQIPDRRSVQSGVMPSHLTDDERRDYPVKTVVTNATDTWLRDEAERAGVSVGEILRRLIAAAMDETPRTRRV